MDEKISIWYDAEGDYLEINLERKPGYYRETTDDAVMEKVDMDGRVIGFSIIGVSKLRGAPLDLVAAR